MFVLLLDLIRTWLMDLGVYRFVQVFDQVQFRALAAAAFAFVLVVLLGRRTIAWLTHLKMGDSGETDAELLRAHAATKANVPTMGGILIGGAIFASVLLLGDIREFLVQMGLVVLVWLGVLGGVDDYLKLTGSRRGQGRQGLRAWEKLVFQLAIGLIVGLFLYRNGAASDGHSLWHVLNLPLQATYQPGASGLADGLIFLPQWAFVLISVLLIAGLSNAVNITDGMDGLAGGISSVVSFGLLLLALIAGSAGAAQYLYVPYIEFAGELAVLAGAMAGACLGFLWWNCSPAKVFMGDTGSLPLGGLMGYLAIALRQEIVVLAMCVIFLGEIGSVVLQVGYFKWTRKRTGTGRRIFRVAPFHHHLHMGGWTENQVVVRLWIISILIAVLALASLKVR